MLRNIRNVFERAELTRQEVQTLFGVIESLHRAEPAVRDGDSFAVIFESHQSDDLHGYGSMADAMVAAALASNLDFSGLCRPEPQTTWA